ncbi:hypothetical protein BV20DRAFT_327594 [Pilatotrama ljubarskyi]|nr:hypothetical protein BV20DRAFT_327594 [Pilatotrama ljubarskyi]
MGSATAACDNVNREGRAKAEGSGATVDIAAKAAPWPGYFWGGACRTEARVSSSGGSGRLRRQVVWSVAGKADKERDARYRADVSLGSRNARTLGSCCFRAWFAPSQGCNRPRPDCAKAWIPLRQMQKLDNHPRSGSIMVRWYTSRRECESSHSMSIAQANIVYVCGCGGPRGDGSRYACGRRRCRVPWACTRQRPRFARAYSCPGCGSPEFLRV